ncbi:Abscisic acid G-protein coupled receptor-domain-containing protein [Amylocystis lapponica]|nr:Abscisic acid G-protein coupled receptor-domain-containing protein [Amylocystis lapponica]
MSSRALSVALQTSPLIATRILLFFACRKYLLQTLYHDLQDLSAQHAADMVMQPRTDNNEVELDTLPSPSNSKRSTLISSKRPFHSTLSRSLFSLCFSESCLLFLLLMCQGLDLFNARTRLVNWNISLSLLLAAVLVFIPLSYGLVLSDRYSPASGPNAWQRPSALRIFLNVIPVGLFLFLLSYIPLPSALSSSNITMTTLSRLTVMGTIILGLLSGFGAINTAWTFFPLFSRTKRTHPSEEEVLSAERGLYRVQNDLLQRRLDIQKLEAAQQPATESGWFSRVVPSFRGDSQLSSARQELSGLESLEYEMSRNLEALKQRRANAQFSRTFAGKVFNWGGRMFAVYCVYRIVNSAVNLVVPMRTHGASASPDGAYQTQMGADMLSMSLARLLSLLPSVQFETEDVAVISHQISLGLVGIIILSSIRLVLRGVARALRVTSRNLGASLMLLMLAQLMGIYLLSTLVQLRTSFPPPPLRPDTDPEVGTVNLFATLPEYQLFGALFDGSFLLAAGMSAAGRWFGDRISNTGEPV